MFDMSWGEVMLIGGVALVVIGPKDLPKALRTVGQVTARLKRMAGEFQSQFSEAMREAELDEVRREVEGINRSVAAATTTSFNPVQTIRNEIKGAVDGAGAARGSTDPASAGTAPPSDGPAPDLPPAAKPSPEALAAATAQLRADTAAVPGDTAAPPADAAAQPASALPPDTPAPLAQQQPTAGHTP
ncbi:Sec-independent protein translocase protein TatB [Methylobacterium crusticola]|uniref:Sec-independent protein translocase protein TatB n=1 Tax=Methylobacterium crusticola TaxID=1697972 RepID=A0ABQ4R7R1_9HYPH|nr:Sec-independent protein translocase protein TatB [Methylobacterium crusticola]GJD53199.1 Sec-independent protein translocase protein TatB [Methylobacterium crusticola]